MTPSPQPRTQQPSPSWYDLLGVAPTASAEEIRTAWRASIAALDPTDRRFATFNQAAEVLLDPARRAAYDAELQPEPVEPVPVEPQPDEDAPGQPDPADRPAPRGAVPSWLLIAVAALTLVAAGAAAYLVLTRPADGAVEDATAAAQTAAERAVIPILSYDATRLDESKAAAQQYLTGDYRTEYDKLYEGIIEQNAPSTGTVLTAELVRSSIVRSGEDRVQVFALVNQSRTNKASEEPVVYKQWVTITMEQVDGDWLVAGMDT